MPLVRLGEIALARSGDKGSSANIGVVARTDAGYAFLRDHLTADLVRKFFAPLAPANVTRFELSSIGSLNFLLTGILGGAGGSDSLRIDAQGKALGQALLELQIEVPPELPAMRGD